MKTIVRINCVTGVAIIAATLMFTTSCQKENSMTPGTTDQDVVAKNSNSYVFQPNAHMYGASYSVWCARWWQWALELPVSGHPFIDDPSFDVSAGQSGDVWFLAAPIGTVERTITIPPNTALFVSALNSEWSSLEGFATEAEQLENVNFYSDHIINLFATIDGVTIEDLSSFRVASPQFTFTAPSPWIFGETGGTGTATAGGYYLMFKPLSTGAHILHFGGAFHFSVAEGDPFDYDASVDITYDITVQ